jgi:hypothetical protein
MVPASLASARYHKTLTTGTLRLFSCVVDRGEVHVTHVTGLFHVHGELMKGEETVSTSTDRAVEVYSGLLMLVAYMLSQVIFPEECLGARCGTAGDKC